MAIGKNLDSNQPRKLKEYRYDHQKTNTNFIIRTKSIQPFRIIESRVFKDLFKKQNDFIFGRNVKIKELRTKVRSYSVRIGV